MSPKSVHMFSSAPSRFLMSIFSGRSAMDCVIFTIPHCLSQSTSQTMRSLWRTALSISCGCMPAAPSPMITATGRSGTVTAAPSAWPMPAPSIPIFIVERSRAGGRACV